ncbi:MAG: DNA replication/repair protein RecF [Ignavibacteriae bacterium]|nr:DNA replication/repair protein RecF [Ignavibacteriota bacterium]
MRVTGLRLENFRNHALTRLSGSDSVNVFLGDNGEGKTNILEAVSYLCLTKSFYAGNDRVAAQIGKEYFVLEGELRSDRGLDFTVRVTFDAASAQKKFLVNNAEVETLASVVGRFPVVILSPEGGLVTTGSPSDRRKFIDIAISQASKRYLDELLEYRRVLKQRNKILLDAKIARHDPGDAIEPWSESLVDHGTELIVKRREFVKDFAVQVADAFQKLTGEQETPSLRYLPSVDIDDGADSAAIASEFAVQLTENFSEERRTGSTLVGPHRDEIEFTINGLDLRKFASQGQHKTFLVALKVAEFHYLKEQCNETPVLLLDDVFSELDEHRSHRLLNMVGQLGQTFITSTSEQVFAGALESNSGAKRFFVKQGVVTNEEAGNFVH